MHHSALIKRARCSTVLRSTSSVIFFSYYHFFRILPCPLITGLIAPYGNQSALEPSEGCSLWYIFKSNVHRGKN